MTKQEKIKEEVWQTLRRGNVDIAEADALLEAILSCLHSQGVVIKVDRELPENPYSDRYLNLEDGDVNRARREMAYARAQQNMLRVGYVAVEPIIKEG